MVIYRRKWLDQRLELRVDRKKFGIYYLRKAVGGGYYVRDHQSMPFPWHTFT